MNHDRTRPFLMDGHPTRFTARARFLGNMAVFTVIALTLLMAALVLATWWTR